MDSILDVEKSSIIIFNRDAYRSSYLGATCAVSVKDMQTKKLKHRELAKHLQRFIDDKSLSDAEISAYMDYQSKGQISPLANKLIYAQQQKELTIKMIYEEIFSPLKILGVQSQFSWGVMGIKRETAIEIENKDNSGLLTFSSSDPETERFERLTAEKDRSWSYLYAAIPPNQPIKNAAKIIAPIISFSF